MLTPYRPAFLALTFTSLAFTHHQYRDRRRTVLALALALGLASTPELIQWYNKRGGPTGKAFSSAAAERQQHQVQLQVIGLKCVSCAMRVKQRLQTHLVGQEGSCQVDFPSGQTFVTGSDLKPSELAAAVQEMGYEVHVVAEPHKPHLTSIQTGQSTRSEHN